MNDDSITLPVGAYIQYDTAGLIHRLLAIAETECLEDNWMKAVITQAAAALEKTQWRPIATAPKTTWIIGGMVDGPVAKVIYQTALQSWCTSPGNTNLTLSECQIGAPTHWLPLPDAPKEDAK